MKKTSTKQETKKKRFRTKSPEPNKECYFDKIPMDVQIQIFSYLDVNDLLFSTSLVCKRMNIDENNSLSKCT